MVASREVYLAAKTALSKAGVEDAGFEADTLMAHVTGIHRLQLPEISEADKETLFALVARRCRREPLQYILGSWDFLDLRLEVGPGVLIPRPETEEVCLAAAKTLVGKTHPTVLDLCAGSGALALGIQQLRPNTLVTAVEWFTPACHYLEKNILQYAQNHSPAPAFTQADVREYHRNLAPKSIDLIVSNPPYVSDEEYLTLMPELAFEPKSALVAPENGLFFYRYIIHHYQFSLKPGGALVFEIGTEQAHSVAGFLERAGYRDIQIQADLQGNPRIALAVAE